VSGDWEVGSVSLTSVLYDRWNEKRSGTKNLMSILDASEIARGRRGD
jgi:hypothetical protein